MSGNLDQLAGALARRLADPDYLDLVAEAVSEKLIDRLGIEPEPFLLDAHQVAARLNVTAPTIRKWARAGRIPIAEQSPAPIRPRMRFDAAAVDAALARFNGDGRAE